MVSTGACRMRMKVDWLIEGHMFSSVIFSLLLTRWES